MVNLKHICEFLNQLIIFFRSDPPGAFENAKEGHQQIMAEMTFPPVTRSTQNSNHLATLSDTPLYSHTQKIPDSGSKSSASENIEGLSTSPMPKQNLIQKPTMKTINTYELMRSHFQNIDKFLAIKNKLSKQSNFRKRVQRNSRTNVPLFPHHAEYVV